MTAMRTVQGPSFVAQTTVPPSQVASGTPRMTAVRRGALKAGPASVGRALASLLPTAKEMVLFVVLANVVILTSHLLSSSLTSLTLSD